MAGPSLTKADSSGSQGDIVVRGGGLAGEQHKKQLSMQRISLPHSNTTKCGEIYCIYHICVIKLSIMVLIRLSFNPTADGG